MTTTPIKKMKVGDLIQDCDDGEIGLVVSVGPGYHVKEDNDYPDGNMPSWRVRWPSLPYACDLGEDSLTEGLVKIIHAA
jgi:hypothetical protein